MIEMTNSRIQYDLGVFVFGVEIFSLSSIRSCFTRNFSLVKFYLGKQNNESYLEEDISVASLQIHSAKYNDYSLSGVWCLVFICLGLYCTAPFGTRGRAYNINIQALQRTLNLDYPMLSY